MPTSHDGEGQPEDALALIKEQMATLSANFASLRTRLDQMHAENTSRSRPVASRTTHAASSTPSFEASVDERNEPHPTDEAFPYFYVLYDEDLPQDVSCASTFVHSLAFAIEKALKLASNAGAKRQHIYSCSLVRGRKFYGFHIEEQLFVKIVLYSAVPAAERVHRRFYDTWHDPHDTEAPIAEVMDTISQPSESLAISEILIADTASSALLLDDNNKGCTLDSRDRNGALDNIFLTTKRRYYPQEVPRLSELLLGGGILNRRFQPYESHIPFLLQVMVDHNLAGMGHVHLSDIKFRQPVLKNQFISICASQSSFKNVVSLLSKHIPSSGSSIVDARLPIGKLMEIWCSKVDKAEELLSILPEKQSTCELEGDTCVEAILNQSELTYTPLEKATSDVRMIQSLIPIWDELNVTRKTDVFKKERNPSSNSYGHAVRHREMFDQMLQRSFEVYKGSPSNSGFDELRTESVQEDFNMSQKSSLKSSALLLCTQAAHSKNSLSRKQHIENDFRSVSMDSGRNNEEDVLLNEELIRHQLTQTSQPSNVSDTLVHISSDLIYTLHSQWDSSAGYRAA
ncbi:hypothetical protein L7F22_054253 [Adiantum nelumboides]|nr:hypothetical protein [Adiantum nelumboides]